MKAVPVLVIGAALGLTAGLALQTLRTPSNDWRNSADAFSMPNRRAYTLPLNNPDMIPASQALHMLADDLVIGLQFRDQHRAYPWWLISNYHVVNDTLDNEPLLLTLCEVCGGAAAFRPLVPELPNQPLTFQIVGVHQGTIELGDHQTRSRWHPFLGLAHSGPLAGRSLHRYPVHLMTWKAWTQLHPETTVVNGSPHLRRRPHGSESHPIGHPDLSDPFLRSANLNDTRLERHEIVLGIRFPEINRAFALPEKLLTPYPNLFLVTLANRPILIARQNELAITTFDLGSTPDHSRVTLLSQCPIRFRTKDGLVWNEFGLSRDAAGRQLQLPIPASYLTEWYEWVTHSPQTQIVTNISLLPPP